MPLTTMEYRLLAELSVNAGKVLAHEHLLEKVWNEKSDANLSPMRTLVAKLRTKLDEDARNLRYVVTATRVATGCRRGRGQDGKGRRQRGCYPSAVGRNRCSCVWAIIRSSVASVNTLPSVLVIRLRMSSRRTPNPRPSIHATTSKSG